MSFDDEYIDDPYNFKDPYADAEEKAMRKKRYDSAYLHTVERRGATLPPEEREDVYEELHRNYNIAHSTNPVLDGEHNFLAAKAAVDHRIEKDPHLKGLMDHIDRREKSALFYMDHSLHSKAEHKSRTTVKSCAWRGIAPGSMK